VPTYKCVDDGGPLPSNTWDASDQNVQLEGEEDHNHSEIEIYPTVLTMAADHFHRGIVQLVVDRAMVQHRALQ
jgi:hypothetical protein